MITTTPYRSRHAYVSVTQVADHATPYVYAGKHHKRS